VRDGAETLAPVSESATRKPPKTWKRRLKRALLWTAIGMPIFVVLLFIAVHKIRWLGPALADGLRWLIGTDRVAAIEDWVYGVEDRWNQWWKGDEPPKTYWDAPAPGEVPPAASVESADGGPSLPAFHLDNVGPLYFKQAAPSDGTWVPVADPTRPGAATLMMKTLVHPDSKRPWAEVFVVALDLRQIDLHWIESSEEPKTEVDESKSYARRDRIPAEAEPLLVAAFNGGFKGEHGHWGVRVGSTLLVKPRAIGCAVAHYKDGSLRIEPWSDLESTDADIDWFRQTPPCMLRAGKRHGGLWDPDSKNWGAAVGGDTVIRRSAIGLDPDHKVLFVAVTNATIAQALADGMKHVGATDVAQLDVNHSFPRFVIFPQSEGGQREATSLFDGFEVEPGDYLREGQPRDFFYVTRRSD
jgi:hypothetical protein